MQVQELVSVSASNVASSNAATPFAILVNASVVDDVLAEVTINHPTNTMSERDHFVECLEACGDCV
ncbi:MAG TPA: hypothetical protein VGJ90_02380 [Methylophilaceae bacterium]|jgi:hypothetical protein